MKSPFLVSTISSSSSRAAKWASKTSCQGSFRSGVSGRESTTRDLRLRGKIMPPVAGWEEGCGSAGKFWVGGGAGGLANWPVCPGKGGRLSREIICAAAAGGGGGGDEAVVRSRNNRFRRLYGICSDFIVSGPRRLNSHAARVQFCRRRLSRCTMGTGVEVASEDAYLARPAKSVM